MKVVRTKIRGIGWITFWADPNLLAKASHVEHVVPLVKVSLAPHHGRLVLDCGCGIGVVSQMLRRDGMTVVGIDILVQKLNVARKSNSKDVSFVAADANALPFRDDCFNGVVFQSVLTYTSIQASLLEARRILVPGGALVMCEFNSMNPWVKLKRGWGSREIFTPAQYKTIILGAKFFIVLLKTIDFLPTRLRVALPDYGTALSFFEMADRKLSQIPGLGTLGGFVLVRAQKPDKLQVSSMRS